MKFTFTQLILLILFLIGSQSINAQNVIWTEDFADGQVPAGWTNIDISGQISAPWEWKVSTPPIMLYDFESPTAANGFLTFDSGAAGLLFTPHDTRLTSTAIDCSSLSTVVVRFSSQFTFATSTSQTYLGVSTNGTTFSYYPILNNAIVNNVLAKVTTEEVDISATAAGQSTVYLQFRWFGNWEYAWSIDDVQVQDMFTPPFPNDLAVTNYLLPNTHQTPARQMDTIFFDAEIENIGINTQTNVQVEARITDTITNQTIYSDIIGLGSIAPNSNAVNAVFNNYFVPYNLQPSDYRLSYIVTQDSTDNEPTNNQFDFYFTVSDTTFAIDNGNFIWVFAGGNGIQNAGPYGIANYYYVPNDSSKATSVSFAVANANQRAGETIDLFLYQVDVDGDGDLDNNGDNIFNQADVINHVVAFANYTFTGAEQSSELINVPLENFLNPNSEIELVEEGNYLVYLGYTGSNLLLVTVGEPVEYNNITTIGVNTTQDTWALGGLPSGFLAILRLHTEDLGTTTINRLGSESFQISPNPASSAFHVEIDLEKLSKNVTITCLNMNGQVVKRQYLKNVQQQVLQYDVDELSPGTYFMNIQTDLGSRTEKLIILK